MKEVEIVRLVAVRNLQLELTDDEWVEEITHIVLSQLCSKLERKIEAHQDDGWRFSVPADDAFKFVTLVAEQFDSTVICVKLDFSLDTDLECVSGESKLACSNLARRQVNSPLKLVVDNTGLTLEGRKLISPAEGDLSGTLG